MVGSTDVVADFYRPFFLTMFFFLSGYLYKQPISFGEHLRKKAVALLIPWFTFGTINILLSQIMSYKEKKNIVIAFEHMWLQVRGLDDWMWFVAALFVAYIPFYFFAKNKNKWTSLAVSLVLLILSTLYSQLMPDSVFPWGKNGLPWHIEYMFVAMFYMLLGYYYKQHFEGLIDTNKRFVRMILLWGIYILIVYICFDNNILNAGWEFVCSLVGIGALINTCKSIHSNRYFDFVGANTLIYLGIHGKVSAFIEAVVKKMLGSTYSGIMQSHVLSNIEAFSLTILISVVLILPTIIIQRYFPWMIGKKYSRKND